jgi:hypothetical protein
MKPTGLPPIVWLSRKLGENLPDSHYGSGQGPVPDEQGQREEEGMT